MVVDILIEDSKKYAEAVVLVPRNAAAHFWKGYAHYYLKEYPTALTELNLAEEQGHSPVEISKVRWFLHYEAKNYPAAAEAYGKAVQLDPNDKTSAHFLRMAQAGK